MLFYSFSNSYVQRECLLTELSALSHIAAKLWFATIYPKFLSLNVNLMYAYKERWLHIKEKRIK